MDTSKKISLSLSRTKHRQSDELCFFELDRRAESRRSGEPSRPHVDELWDGLTKPHDELVEEELEHAREDDRAGGDGDEDGEDDVAGDVVDGVAAVVRDAVVEHRLELSQLELCHREGGRPNKKSTGFARGEI